MKTLSNRHMAFVDEYMINGRNATAAYASVYPKASRKTAESNGYLLLQKTEIKAEIERREIDLREKNKITLEDLTQKLMAIYSSASEFAPAAAVAAIKLIGEWHGIGKETTQEQSTESGPLEIKINIVNSKQDESNTDNSN